MLAETVLVATAWGYYRCAGDDESSKYLGIHAGAAADARSF